MSVRLCYLERGRRGGMLRAMRLVGQGVDERWPGSAVPLLESADAAFPWIERGAEWVQERLAHSRAADRLEAVILDVDGSTCSWLAGHGLDIQAVAAAARMGPSGSGDALTDMPGADTTSVTPVTFFAGESLDSTIQPLAIAHEDDEEGPTESGGGTLLARLKKAPTKTQPIPTSRRGILAACDVPARLLIDALDRRGVVVGRAMTLWHALAQAWDPASQIRAAADDFDSVEPSSDTVCAVIAVDMGDPPAADGVGATPPRLIWAWSRRGSVLAGGSMRLGHVRTDDESGILLGQSEASRLATEWLAWSMQLGVSPRQVVCALPESTRENGSARAFGTALSKAWDGASVDAGVYDDPIGATFDRLATALERTPADVASLGDPGSALVALSARPGEAHRTMYKWIAGVVLVAAVVMGIVTWQAVRSAESVNQSMFVWQSKGIETAKQALGNIPPGDALSALRGAVRQAERSLTPPSRVVPAKPIMEELETISMVISHADLTLESIDLSSAVLARFTLTAKEIGPLEKVTKALRQISGSHVISWEADYREFNRPSGEKAVRATFMGSWKPTTGGAQ